MGNTQGRSPEENNKKKKAKSPKSHNGKQLSPTPGRSGISHRNSPAVNGSNHRESSIHLPLKEYEVPDFLKDTQPQRLQGNSSPVVKRNLKDPDFSTMNGSGLMIPREELTIPEFLRSYEDTEQHDANIPVGNYKSGYAQGNTGVGNRGQAERGERSRPSKSSNGVRDYGEMNGEQRTGEQSRDRKQDQERRGIRKQQENSRAVEYQKKLYRASNERPVLPGKGSNDTMLSSKTSSDTDSDFRLHWPHTITFADMGEGEGITSDEFSLNRKYKKESSHRVKTRRQNGASLDLIERLGPSVKTQLEAGGRRKSHNWPTDTDSVQSSSSQSFTEPISPISSGKDKFSVSVRDHGDLALKGITPNGVLSSTGKLHLPSTSNGNAEDDADSLPSTQRNGNLNASIGYNESSPEQVTSKVKRKDSLQARLRTRITKLEKANKAFPRARYDSDSTTVSDHSAFEEVLPNYMRRKSASGVNSLNDLPEDILFFILSHLPTIDLCRASGVCQKWQALCWDPLLWSTIDLTNYQDSDINKVLRNILAKLAMDTQGYCLNVHAIKLNGCELLSDKALGFIARFCIDLEDLDVSGCCCITSKGLHDILANCHEVTHLDISGCTCVNSISAPVANGFGLGHHGTFLKLRHLDLSDCVAFDDLGLRVVGLSCGMLESLYLRRCNRVTDIGIKHIAQHCSRLKELSVSDCLKVRDFSLKEIAKNCACLKYLSAAKCPVTDTGMKYIGKHCVKLKYLNVRGCEAVSDVGITHIVQNCLKLRSLDAGKCDITDNGLHIIGIHCPQLKKLSVRGCERVTDIGVKTIASQCCSLQYLNVQECSLTYETFMYIREHCKNCVIEHTCPAFF